MATNNSSGSADGAGAPKKSSVKGVLVELLLVTILAAGAGGLLATLTPVPTPAPMSAPGAAGAHGAPAATVACGTSASNLLDLPPIVTNLGSPADVWVRVEASIVFDPKTLSNPEIVAAEIATDELAYLRTIPLTQLQGPIGLQDIRQDLTDRAVVRSGGKVSELILRTLVVQ